MKHGPARVLLVEDDVSLQRFVQMALEELPIELRVCNTVAGAIAELAAQPVDLLITDLMLPDRSGMELLAELVAAPALRGGAVLVAFSAGLRPEVRAQLGELDVWRMLSKPCSLADLESCVLEALEQTGGGSARPTSAAAPNDAPALHPHGAAIAASFGGSSELYDSFRAACLRQFPLDIEAGERACSAQDAAALRRLAHSLKSVLASLGHAQQATLARALEEQAHACDWPQALPNWQRLRHALRQLH